MGVKGQLRTGWARLSPGGYFAGTVGGDGRPQKASCDVCEPLATCKARSRFSLMGSGCVASRLVMSHRGD